MDFNTKFPTWAEGTEPSDEIKASGFQPGYKPPAAFFNWFWNLMLSGASELQEKLSLTEEEFNEQIELLKKSGTGKHASSHAENGADPIAPYDIGAIDAMIGLVNGTTYTFDTALTQGEYNVQAEDAAGAPYAGMLYGKLIVTLNDGKTKEDTNWIWQEFLPASVSKQRCWRMKINTGDWTDWFVYYDTGHKPTPDDLDGVVPIAKGGTGATTASKAANSLGVYSLLTGTTIPESSDLNSYITPGNYCCGMSATAGTMTNCPTYNAFTMRVFYANGSQYYIGQELVDYSTGVRYYRLYSASSDKWGDWIAPVSASAKSVNLSTTWTEQSDGTFAQTVSVDGVTADKEQAITVDCALSGTDIDADIAVLEAWGCVNRCDQSYGKLTFVCYGDTPTVAIPLNVVVM